MAVLSDLAKLVCGGSAIDAAASDCEISQILRHLRSVLETTLMELHWLGKEPDARISLYGPFLARSLLEVSATALIGRLDPTRILVVKRTQEHGSYDTHQPWQTAIRWQGDVVDKKVADLWTPEKSYKEMTKALFGDYYVQIYWMLALKRLADASFTGGTWLAEIKGKQIGEFAASRRDAIGKLYSESSKGVHSEFVVPPGSIYDKLTVQNLVEKSMQLVSELGLMVNLLPHIPYKLETSEAVAMFNGIEDIEVMS